MTTFLDFIENEDSAAVSPPSVAEASVVPAVETTGQLSTREEEINSQLRELENELLAQSLGQVRDGLAWPEVAKELDPKDETEIPEEWVQQLGKKKAREKFRVARANILPAKDAPMGLKQSVQLATGIIKARAHEKTGPKILNINLVEMPQMVVQYPETEVKDRKG